MPSDKHLSQTLRVLAAVLVCGVTAGMARAAQSTRATNQGSDKTPAASGTPSNKVVIAFGDEKMTAADLEKWIQALPPGFREYYGGAGKSKLPEYIVRMKVLSDEAARQKLPDQPEVAMALETARESILADAEAKEIERDVKVSDQDFQDAYQDAQQKHNSQLQQIRISRILIRTTDAVMTTGDAAQPALGEQDARKKLEDIRQKIIAGADFGSMAKQYSEDPATARAGGDMGYVDQSKMVPPIVAAAYELPVGGVSDIIATPWGLEIIKVSEKHMRSLDEAKPFLETQIRQRKTAAIIKQMQDRYKVTVDDQFFGISPGKKTSSTPPPSR